MLSSRGRLEKICTDIIFDMSIRPRLASGRGNAMLVAGSIPEACRLFEFFRNSGTPIADKCAIVTSYKRAAAEISASAAPAGSRWRWRSSTPILSPASLMLWPSRTLTLIAPTRLMRPALMPSMRLR